MSHVDQFNEEMGHAAMAQNVLGRAQRKSYRETDFQVTKQAMATPKRFRMAETPRRRRIHFQPDLVASVEEEANADVLAALTKKTWKVYRVSPLFRFERGKKTAGAAAASKSITRHDINNKENKTGNKAANHDDTADLTIVPDPTDLDDEFIEKLEEYLEDRLVSSVPQDWMRTFKHTYNETTFNVSIEVVKGLRGNREDAESLKFSVGLTTRKELKKGRRGKKKKKAAEHVDSEKHLLTAYLLAVDSAEMTGLSSRLMETTRVLPCCLVNGDPTILSALFKALEKRFDTIIYPMDFLPEHLQWMLAMWSMLEKTEPKHKQSPAEVSVEAANNADPSSSLMPPPPPPPPLPSEDATVHLTYVTPEQVEGIRQLNLQFPRKVMAGIRRRAFAGDHVTDAEVDSFNSILEHEIGCSLKFSLSGNGSGNGCDLVHIQAPAFSCKAALSSSGAGQIRMERADKVKTVLCYLTELCQGSVRNPYPKMSTEDDFVIGEAS